MSASEPEVLPLDPEVLAEIQRDADAGDIDRAHELLLAESRRLGAIPEGGKT
jgi:hypothetical protein